MSNNVLPNGKHIVVRPIHPEDEQLYKCFMDKCTAEDIRHRFFDSMRDLPSELVTQLTHIDYLHIMAFVAVNDENGELLAISRFVAAPEGNRAEFSVITRSDWQGQGVGFLLMQVLIKYAQAKNICVMWGQINRDNSQMVRMSRELGFQITTDHSDPCCVVATLQLLSPAKSSP